jgi:hypothetical protein
VRHLPLLLVLLTLSACGPAIVESSVRRVSTLPDVSGLVWVRDSLFVAAHDAKLGRGEESLPRLSLVWMGASPGGVRWRPLVVEWPGSGPSSDLESASPIPGTDRVLVAESGDDLGGRRRIFILDVSGSLPRLLDSIDWPMDVVNVEGTAVAAFEDRLVFLFAEREHGRFESRLRWADFDPVDFGFGAFQEVPIAIPADAGMNRPVSAIEVDSEGWIYIASAFDPEVDDGPYRSAVWRAGRLAAGDGGDPSVEVLPSPRLVARADGVKIESLAIRTRPDGTRQLIVGTDDENLGAVLRPLPLEP